MFELYNQNLINEEDADEEDEKEKILEEDIKNNKEALIENPEYIKIEEKKEMI